MHDIVILCSSLDSVLQQTAIYLLILCYANIVLPNKAPIMIVMIIIVLIAIIIDHITFNFCVELVSLYSLKMFELINQFMIAITLLTQAHLALYQTCEAR